MYIFIILIFSNFNKKIIFKIYIKDFGLYIYIYIYILVINSIYLK